MNHSFHRYRLHFRKLGDLRWIGHHDLARTVERLLRRLELPLRMSQGYHPKPKIRFVAALALGIESDVEWVEVELTSPIDPAQLQVQLNEQSPAGLEFVGVERVEGKMPQLAAAEYEFLVPPHASETVAQAVERLREQRALPVERPERNTTVDILPGILHIALDDARLRFQIASGRQGAVRPREVLQALGIDSLETQGGVLRRIGLTFAQDGDPALPAVSVKDEAPLATEPEPAKHDVHPQILRSLDETQP